MDIIFKDEVLKEIFETGKTKDSRYKVLCKDSRFIKSYVRVVRTISAVENASELSDFSFLHYEKLKHCKPPLSSVRIMNGRVERLLFEELEDGILIELIEINQTHYGNKK